MGHRDDSAGSSSDAQFDALLQDAVHLSPVRGVPLGALRQGAELGRGRFLLGRKLGEGGMGVVFQAHDRQRKQQVALKTLSCLDATGIYRLKNEFRSLCEVNHPNLVRLGELFAEEGMWLFSMELVHGKPFDAFVRVDGQVDPERLQRTCRQLVAGVQAIHGAGKLHRDLKQDNVLVTDGGRVVILDFGLVADVAEAGRGHTLPDAGPVGTPGYMAPEQAAGEAAAEHTDWYQVGVMLYETLTGELPFRGTVGAILAAKQTQAAPHLDAALHDCDPRLAALVDQLLSRDPRSRPDGPALRAHFGTDALHGPTETPVGRPRLPTVALFGRDRELDFMREALADSRKGLPTVLRIVADSGMGKSALVGHFIEELASDGSALVFEGRCYERENVPFKAFDRVIDSLTRHLLQLPPAEFAALLPRDAHDLCRLFPVMGRLKPIRDAPQRVALTEQEARRRAFDALAELLARLGDRWPLVIAVDDLQWSDLDSSLLFEHLVRHPDGARVLFLVAHRDVDRNTLPEHLAQHQRRLQLGPLSASAATRMAQSLLPERSDHDALVKVITAEAAGSPFFVHQLCQAVSLDDDAKVSVGHVIEQRLQRLGRPAQILLERIAVSAQPVPRNVVVATGHGAADPHHELQRLCAEQLARVDAGQSYECYHDRIREVLYGGLADAERSQRHTELARAWLAHGGADPEVLFEHLQAAGHLADAGQQALLAAERAIRSLAFERAADFYRYAVTYLPDHAVLDGRLRERRAEALSLAGHWAASGNAFVDATASVPEGQRRNYLLHQAAHHLLGSGHGPEGLPLLKRFLKVLRVRWPASELAAMALSMLRLLWLRLSGAPHRIDATEAPEQFDGLGRTVEDLYPGETDRAPEAMILVEGLLDGAGLLPPYDLARGMYFMTAFIRRGLVCGDASRAAVALGMLASLMSASRLSAGFGQRLASRAIEVARQGTSPGHGASALGFAAFARLLDGKLQEALDLGRQGEALLGHHSRTHIYQAWTVKTVQGFALFMMGRVGEAARISQTVAAEARGLGNTLAALGGESVLGCLVHDDRDGAAALLERKERALEQVGRRGVLFQLVTAEAIVLRLYVSRGGDGLALVPHGLSARLMPPYLRALTASCALQALEQGGSTGEALRLVRRARGALARSGVPASQGMVRHLDAALCLHRRDVQGAERALKQADRAYAGVNMELHRQLMRFRLGELQGHAEGDALVAEAMAYMVAQEITDPRAWAQLLAAGLNPPT